MIGKGLDFGSLRSGRARLVVEVALAALLAVQVGRLAWIVIDPHQSAAPTDIRATVANPADASIFQSFDAFFRTGGQSSLAEATGADSSQMRLFGVRADGAGGGSAIIGLADGRQMSVAVGEEVEPGLVLKEVGADFVTLARGASLSRLIFTEAPTGAAAPPPPPATPQTISPQSTTAAAPAAEASAAPAASGPAVDPARLMAEASLRPRMNGLRVNGFTVGVRGDGAALRAAGLQAGDVIVAVNGSSLNSLERVAELRDELSSSSSAEIRFERGGQIQTTTLRIGQ